MSSNPSSKLVGVLIALIFIAGVGGYFAGSSSAPAKTVRTTATQTITTGAAGTATVTVTQTLTRTVTVTSTSTSPPPITTPATPFRVRIFTGGTGGVYYPLGTAIADWSGSPFKSALLVAHMFVFYFGILADLTPPVALATYAGSALAKSNFWKTAFNASTYALAGYLVPYIFATNPSLLIITVRYWDFTAVASLVTGIAVIVITMLFLSSGIVGWLGGQLNRVNQIAITLAGVLIYVLTVVLKSESTLVIAVATLVYLAIYMVNLRRFKQQM